VLLQLVGDLRLHLLVAGGLIPGPREAEVDSLADVAGPEVGGHHDDGVLEVHHATLGVGETPLVEDLDPGDPASRIDEDAVAGGLPGQAGTAGPEGQWGTLTTSVGKQVQDVVDALGPRYLHRGESIMRGVVRHS